MPMKRTLSVTSRVCFDPNVKEKLCSPSKEFPALTMQEVMKLKDLFAVQANGEDTIASANVKNAMPSGLQKSLSDEEVLRLCSKCSALNIDMFLQLMNDLYKYNKEQLALRREAVRQYRVQKRNEANCALQGCIPVCMCSLDLNTPSNSPSEKKVSFEIEEEKCKRTRSSTEFFDLFIEST